MTRRVAVLAGAWLVGVLLTAGALWLIVDSTYVEDKAATAALALTASLSFITSGLIAIWRRPENRIGLLMTAVGYLWLLGALTTANDRWVFTLGFLVASLAWGAFANLILAFPSGHLESAFHRGIVWFTYGLVTVEALALTLVGGTDEGCPGDDCPESTIVVWKSDTAADVITVVGTLGVVAIVITSLAILTRRWRAATAARRRALGLVLLTAGATLVLLLVIPIADLVSADLSQALQYATLVAFGAVPIAFLVGVLRARLARSAAGDMLLELGAGTPLRDALAHAIHDPSLEIGYWLPDSERYVDSDGGELPAIPDDRAVTHVEREGRPIAILVHDAALEDEPELLDTASAAAGLWLENERLQAELRAQYSFLLTVVQTAPSLLVAVGTDGRIENFNTAVEVASGLDDPEQIRNRPFWEVFFDPADRDEIKQRFFDAAPDFAPAEYENTFTNARGEQLVIAWTSAPLVDENGDVIRVIAGGVDITERKRQELVLRESGERLHAVIQSSPAAIVEVDLDGLVASWNAGAERIFGWTAEEVLGKPECVVPPEYAAESIELDRRIDAHEVIDGYETMRLRKDGSLVDVAISAAPVHDPHGAIVGHIGVYTDITGRKRQERALRESEARLSAAIESSPVAIVEVSLDSQITRWNPAAEEIFGWTAEEATTQSLPMVPDEHLDEYFALVAQVRAGRSYTGHETVRRRKDGTLVDVGISSAPIRTADGTVVGHMAIFVDITERKQRERELRESEERLRAAIESSPVAIVEVGNDDRIIAWNRAAEDTFGWSAEEVIGSPVPFIPPDRRDEVKALVARIMSGQTYTGVETVRTRKDGQQIDVELSSAPIRDTNGEVVSRMAVFADITERKRRELQLQSSEERRRAVIEASPVAIVEVALDGQIRQWNQAAEDMFGWTAEEAMTSDLDLVPPEREDEYNALLSRVRAGHAYAGHESQRLRKDGTLVDVEVSSAPIRDSSGAFVGHMALFVDVTERKLREQAVRRSEERIRAAIEASPIAIVELAVSGDVLMWNPAAERLFGWAADEVVGRRLPVVPDQRRAEYLQITDLVRQGIVQAGHETVRQRKDGSLVDVEISSAPIRDSSGEVGSYMSVYVDTTERKRREEEIQRERDFLDTLAEAVPSFLAVVDTEGRFVDDAVNRAYTETFGWSSQDLEGESFLEFVAPEDTYSTSMALAAAANGVARTDLESHWLTKGGEERIVGWTATPLLEARSIPLVLITGADLTERVRQEREIRASRQRLVETADAERRRLERNLHDGAQQRLVALSVSLRLAEAKLVGDPEGARELLTASREELSFAIDELRELARGIHPAVLTDRGLSAAIDALVARSPLPVEATVPEERLPPSVEAAAYYVVSEALANIVKYAGATAASVTIAHDSEEGIVTVEVADDGCGGADPTTGSGLRGLVDRVAALDGTLAVESPVGEGTRVLAAIPVREPALSK